MKTMKTRIVWALCAALAFTACDNNEIDGDWNGEIRLSSDVNTLSVTKAFDLDTKIKEGRQVSVWVDDAKDTQAPVTTELLYENKFLTVGSGGALTGDPMFFPATGNKVNIYAIHPTYGSVGVESFPSAYVHEVKADQTSADNYAASDLLYAVSQGVARTSSVTKLTFNHILSKVVVNLESGDGSPAFGTVTLEDLKLEASFAPAKSTNLSDCNLTVPSEGNEPTSITITNSTVDSNEAIVVPQTWEAGANKAFIKIKLADGGELAYVPTENITFASGKKYTFTITAKLTGLEVSSEIADWSTEGVTTINGDATMP